MTPATLRNGLTEIYRRHTDVVGTVPDRNSLIWLVGAVLAEHDEWIEGRYYLGLEVLGCSRMNVVPDACADEAHEPRAAPPSAANPARAHRRSIATDNLQAGTQRWAPAVRTARVAPSLRRAWRGS